MSEIDRDHRITAARDSTPVEKFSIRLVDAEFNGFSPEQQNQITDMLRMQISRKNGISSHKVWVGLQEGSLVVRGEVQEPAGEHQNPTEDEVREIVRSVQRAPTRTAPTNLSEAGRGTSAEGLAGQAGKAIDVLGVSAA